MYTYRNLWFRADRSIHGDPEFYRTDAKPVQVGKYQRFHRIKGSNKSGHCYDYVLDGVVVTQRCGGGLTESDLDAYVSNREAA